MRNLNWKSVGLGVITDFGLTLVLGGLTGIVAVAMQASQGVPLGQVGTVMTQNGAVLVFSMIMGLLATLLGAFVAANKSDSRQMALRQAGVFAAISICLGFLLQTTMPESYPLWYNILAYLLILPVALLGGLWRWRNLSRANRVLETPQSPFPEVPRKL